MKNKFFLLPFAIFVFAMALPLAKAECVAPRDCYSQECAGLPSYPTFAFENCLNACNATYWDKVNAYNACLQAEQDEQQRQLEAQQEAERQAQLQQQLQQQQAQQNVNCSQPANAEQEAQCAAKQQQLQQQQIQQQNLLKPVPAKSPKSKIHEFTVNGDSLSDNYEVRAAKDQRIIIGYSDGTKIVLEPGSSMRVIDPHSAEAIWGKLILRIKKGRHYRIHNTTAVAGVRGTEFDFNTTKSSTVIRVFDGAVDVSDPALKKTKQIKAGYQVTVKKNGKIGAVRKILSSVIKKWKTDNAQNPE